MKGKSFISTGDFSKDDLEAVLKLAAKIKKDGCEKALENKTLAMVFFNPSLRTRTSFEAGMYLLGGHAINLEVGKAVWNLEHNEGVVMDKESAEHIKDASKVLSRYCNAIAVRSFPELKSWEEDKKDLIINGFSKYSDVPVINMESCLWHPCQALADIMTIKENFNPEGKKFVLTWAYHPKPLPMAVPNSAALIAAQFGMDVTIANPKGYELDKDILDDVRKNCEANGRSLVVVNDMKEVLKGANIVYAKSWGPISYYNKWDKEKKVREKLRNWIVDKEKMGMTDNAKFMHCLPIRRNVVATDDVVDDASSIVYDTAENRLHVQNALLSMMLTQRGLV